MRTFFRSRRGWSAVFGLLAGLSVVRVSAKAQLPLGAVQAPQGEIRHGRELLTNKHFAEARKVFADYLRTHPDSMQAELGLGDAQLGMHQYETAELTYRDVVRQQPELWQAHKNLVVVEAALGRWEEFDRERTVLRMARERGAPGISARESDVVDSFKVHGEPWVVRAYFQPVGRSEARYNFEHFSADGRVQAYVSLENADAAQRALKPDDVRIGAPGTDTKASVPANSADSNVLSLNWYTGTAHGTIRTYPGSDSAAEPSYEMLRAEVICWLAAHPAVTVSGPPSPAKPTSYRPSTPAQHD